MGLDYNAIEKVDREYKIMDEQLKCPECGLYMQKIHLHNQHHGYYIYSCKCGFSTDIIQEKRTYK